MTILHETITLERHYDATPEGVFRAFSDAEAKALWFPGGLDDWTVQAGRTLDFREGGREHSATGPVGGEFYHYTALYHDIVPNQRIVLSYEMSHSGRRISVSMQSIELFRQHGGTRLVLTDQGAYLDGLDVPQQRRGGIEYELERLAKALTTG